MNGFVSLPWLLGALAGSMLFFAVVVAPSVFRALPAEQAGKFLRLLFPRYYLWGLALALLCCLAAWLATASVVITATCVLVTLLFIYARQVLLPRINRARDAMLGGDAAAAQRFNRLHRLSVVINLLQLLLLLGVAIYLLFL